MERLIKGINTGDTELQASKAVIMQNYPRDFVGAYAYLSQQVSRLHGGAQLKDHKYQKCRILEVNTGGGRGLGADMAVGMDKDMEEAKAVIMKSLGVRRSSMVLMYQTQLKHSQRRNGKLCGTMEAKYM